MIIKHQRLIKKYHGGIKNYRYVGDVSMLTIEQRHPIILSLLVKLNLAIEK